MTKLITLTICLAIVFTITNGQGLLSAITAMPGCDLNSLASGLNSFSSILSQLANANTNNESWNKNGKQVCYLLLC